jgi:NTE family protein
MSRIFIKIFISLGILLICMQIQAQKLGLVLSGGGAKGLAHIGVIRALEENEIPIDYVVGTSIGAIVAGLYACGYSPDEMIAEFKSQRFGNYYRGRIPEEHFYYFKTMPPDAAMLNISVINRDSAMALVLPTNLIATQPMDFGIMEYFSKYSAGASNDFDNLFVPFRCGAADIHNNRYNVFDKGDLGMAVRASMTFPFYFKPVEIDGVLYFDGGIYNNFPHDVMEEVFQPDIMIGSMLTSYARRPEPDNLLSQLENLITGEQTELYINPEKGVTIINDFKDVSLLDFHRIDELERIGYYSTLKLIDSIKSRIPKRVSVDEINEKRKAFKTRQPGYLFDNVNVKGLGRYESMYVERHFKKNSERMSIRQFESEYYKLIADFQIYSARPVVEVNEETGYYDIDLYVKREQAINLRLGANISSGFSNQGFLGVEYKGLKAFSYILSGNIYFGRLYSSFNTGARFDFTTKMPFAIESSLNINRWDYFRGSARLFSLDNRPPYLINFDNNFRADIITPLRNFSVIKLGAATSLSNYQYFHINNFLQTDTSDFTSFNYSTVHFSVVRDNHNFKQYPSKGAKNVISVRYIAGNEKNNPGSTTALNNIYERKHSWIQILLSSDIYHNISKKMTIGTHAEILVSNKPFFRNYFSSILSAPAFIPTPHSKTIFLNNYRTHSYLAAGIKPVFLLSERLNLRAEVYLFAPYEKILRTEPYDRVYAPSVSEIFSYTHIMANISLVYNTPFGAICFSTHYYDNENLKMYYMFHFGYILFNKRGTDY